MKSQRIPLIGKLWPAVALLFVLLFAVGPVGPAAAETSFDEELMQAAKSGDLAKVKILLDEGADVNERDANGWTPLTFAAQRGHVNVVKLLLNRGAEANAKPGDCSSPLMSAAECGHTDVARVLLDNGAAANARLRNGWTALMTAAREGHVDVAGLLLARGAEVNAKLPDGWTPLMSASQRGKVPVVRLLLQCGAEVDAKLGDGRTPLMLAASGGHVDVVRVLLKHGADANVKLHDGWTPLMLAAREKHVDAMTLLLSHGAVPTEPFTLVRVALTKLFFAVVLLWTIAESKEKHADHSVFFARQEWTLRDAYENVIAVIALIFVCSVLEPLWFSGPIPSFVDTLTWGGVCVFFLAAYLKMMKSHGIGLVDFGIDRKHFAGSGIIALNIALVYFALSAAGVGIPPLNLLATESRLLDSPLDAAVIGFGLVFCKELLFRGILFAPVARRAGKWYTIVMLSVVECLIFAELDLTQSVVMFAIFVTFYLIYIRTESLWAPIILHIGINIPLWQPSSMEAMARHFSPSTVEFLYIGFAVWVLLLVDGYRLGNFLSRRKRRHGQKESHEESRLAS